MTKQITRYESTDVGMVPHTEGEYVLWEECERLQAEINLLQAIIRIDHLKKGPGCKCVVCSPDEPVKP